MAVALQLGRVGIELELVQKLAQTRQQCTSGKAAASAMQLLPQNLPNRIRGLPDDLETLDRKLERAGVLSRHCAHQTVLKNSCRSGSGNAFQRCSAFLVYWLAMIFSILNSFLTRGSLTSIARQFIHLSNQVALLFPHFKTMWPDFSLELNFSGIADGTESRIPPYREKCVFSHRRRIGN